MLITPSSILDVQTDRLVSMICDSMQGIAGLVNPIFKMSQQYFEDFLNQNIVRENVWCV
jgi:hypothetical protein